MKCKFNSSLKEILKGCLMKIARITHYIFCTETCPNGTSPLCPLP